MKSSPLLQGRRLKKCSWLLYGKGFRWSGFDGWGLVSVGARKRYLRRKNKGCGKRKERWGDQREKRKKEDWLSKERG